MTARPPIGPTGGVMSDDDMLPVGKPTEAATTNAHNCFMLLVINLTKVKK
jgi:hypothetical protein